MARFKRKRLRDAYRFPGFVPLAAVQEVFGDPKAVVVKLNCHRKRRCVADALDGVAVTTTTGSSKCGICRAEIGGFSCQMAGHPLYQWFCLIDALDQIWANRTPFILQTLDVPGAALVGPQPHLASNDCASRIQR